MANLANLYNQAVANGRMLDVSNMDVDRGVGARLIVAPQTDRARIYFNNELPIGSRSLARYIAAIQLLFGNQGFITYSRYIAEAANTLGGDIQQETTTEFNMPQMNVPQMNMPQMNMPQTNMPQMNIPQMNMPQMNIPRIPSPTASRPLSPQMASPPASPRNEQGNNIGGRLTTLGDRINALPAGYVIDVSNMDANGRRARTVTAPRTNRSGKVGTTRVPIISNNIDNYIQALRLIYGEGADQMFADDIAIVGEALGNRVHQ